MFPSNTANNFVYPTSYNYNLPLPLPLPLPNNNNNNSFFINHENTIHHHHQDPTVSINPMLLSPSSSLPLNEDLINMTFSNSFTMPKQDFNTNVYPSRFINHCRPPVKRDRHSKIYTAQGLRDRRVRLSMDIAREFFDLQDMLGLDKASKTIEWLLRKSSKSISKLKTGGGGGGGRSGGGGGKSLFSSASSSEFEEMADEDSEKSLLSKNMTPLMTTVCDIEKGKMIKKLAFGKESRAKARARARERTKEKKISANRLQQVRFTNQFEQKSSPSYSTKIPAHEPRLNYTQIKKNKQFLGLGCDQQNLISYSQLLSSSDPQNWDINGVISHSAFRPVTTTRHATGHQINGKQWVAHN